MSEYRHNHLATLVTDYCDFVAPVYNNKKIMQCTSYVVPTMMKAPFRSMTFFGITTYINNVIKKIWESRFFLFSWECVQKQIDMIYAEHGLPCKSLTTCKEHFQALHEVGHLPLKISALPEGTQVERNQPCIEITTTLPDFAWLGLMLKAQLLASIWYPSLCATVARQYRKIVQKAFEATTDTNLFENDPRSNMLPFAPASHQSPGAAGAAGLAWLTSMYTSPSAAVTEYLNRNFDGTYRCHKVIPTVDLQTLALQHCEIDEVDRLKMSMCDALQAHACTDFCIRVNDDVWEKLAVRWLPDLAAAIKEHSRFKHYVAFENGAPMCDPLSWLLGTVPLVDTRSISRLDDDTYEVKLAVSKRQLNYICHNRDANFLLYTIALQLPEGEGDEVVGTFSNTHEEESVVDGKSYVCGIFNPSANRAPRDWYQKGALEVLYSYFPGGKNEKGYRELDGVRACCRIGVTPTLAEMIYEGMERCGFAANCVILGPDPACTHHSHDGRCTWHFDSSVFGLDMQYTQALICDDPAKTNPVAREVRVAPSEECTSRINGLCAVRFNDNYSLSVRDSYSQFDASRNFRNALQPVYIDGVVIPTSFSDIRQRISNTLDIE